MIQISSRLPALPSQSSRPSVFNWSFGHVPISDWKDSWELLLSKMQRQLLKLNSEWKVLLRHQIVNIFNWYGSVLFWFDRGIHKILCSPEVFLFLKNILCESDCFIFAICTFTDVSYWKVLAAIAGYSTWAHNGSCRMVVGLVKSRM